MICFTKDGTLTLPERLLKELGWRKDERLNARLSDGSLILQRTPHTVRNRLLIRCFGSFSIEWNGTENPKSSFEQCSHYTEAMFWKKNAMNGQLLFRQNLKY